MRFDCCPESLCRLQQHGPLYLGSCSGFDVIVRPGSYNHGGAWLGKSSSLLSLPRLCPDR